MKIQNIGINNQQKQTNFTSLYASGKKIEPFLDRKLGAIAEELLLNNSKSQEYIHPLMGVLYRLVYVDKNLFPKSPRVINIKMLPDSKLQLSQRKSEKGKSYKVIKRIIDFTPDNWKIFEENLHRNYISLLVETLNVKI